MAKVLKASFPQKCTGCELCVFEAQRQLKKVGVEGALIRIFKSKKENSEFLQFQIDLDPRINQLDIQKIKHICPTMVFEIIEREDSHGLIK